MGCSQQRNKKSVFASGEKSLRHFVVQTDVMFAKLTKDLILDESEEFTSYMRYLRSLQDKNHKWEDDDEIIYYEARRLKDRRIISDSLRDLICELYGYQHFLREGLHEMHQWPEFYIFNPKYLDRVYTECNVDRSMKVYWA